MKDLIDNIKDSPKRTPCGQCGMPCEPAEFHTFAHCLMFQACHDSKSVEANAEFLALNHPAVKAERDALKAEVARLRESLQHIVDEYLAEALAESERIKKRDRFYGKLEPIDW